jgi:hypothetical protein
MMSRWPDRSDANALTTFDIGYDVNENGQLRVDLKHARRRRALALGRWCCFRSPLHRNARYLHLSMLTLGRNNGATQPELPDGLKRKRSVLVLERVHFVLKMA